MSKPGLLLAAVLAAAFSSAQDQDFSKVQIKVTKVAGNVYMLQGEGGNIGASVGEDGIVVVDDQYAPLAEKIQAALKGITDKSIRFIINTHYHGDHTGSNEFFQKQAPIIAHDNVGKRLEECPRAVDLCCNACIGGSLGSFIWPPVWLSARNQFYGSKSNDATTPA